MAGLKARFLLDTDVCIYALAKERSALSRRFENLRAGEAVLSVISYGELRFGLEKSARPEDVARNLEALTAIAPVVDLPAGAAEEYGRIRAHLERAGKPIGGNDLWIAAHARLEQLILVTNNEREFARVPGLKVQNWSA